MTEVSGCLGVTNLTWTKDKSPYLVIGNIIVNDGDTLIIEAGVDVQFAGNYYIQVEGAIKVNGTESERIKIYGVDNWDGIKILNDNGSKLSYVDISGLQNGITGYCDIDNALITSNSWALGAKANYETKNNLYGSLMSSTISGKVSITCNNICNNNITGDTINFYQMPKYQDEEDENRNTIVYSIGHMGPGGGFVFYDKGHYSDGWRYLEAAPLDIGSYVFGLYRPDGENNKEIGGTSTVIGSGRYNTERLVKYMDINGKAYDDYSGDTTSEYAAKKCLDYRYGGKDDWFLPSINELDLMYENLHKKELGSFVSSRWSSRYWSSSEGDYGGSAWYRSFDEGDRGNMYRSDDYYVRALRAF